MIDVYARFQDKDTTAPIFFEDIKVGKKMKEKCSVFLRKFAGRVLFLTAASLFYEEWARL